MTLNKQKGNMYKWVLATWNTVKGVCPHYCKYCYMNRFPLNTPRFDGRELRSDLYKYGKDNIFVGSSCDMWAEVIPDHWIINTLDYCSLFPDNTYLFQSKYPKRFREIPNMLFPQNIILGTTIETNRLYKLSSAGKPVWRKMDMEILAKDFNTMVSIEPIVDFDVIPLTNWMRTISPNFISIGADSQGHDLPEPSWQKVQKLITELENAGIKVWEKDNLQRLKEK